MPIIQAYKKIYTPQGYSHTHPPSYHAHESRISLPRYVHASRLFSTFIINSHVTHNARTLLTLIKSTPHTHIRTHADKSRSRIAFTHHVHALRLRSTFMIRLARHTLTTHHNYVRVSKAQHTTRIFAHTRRRITLTYHAHASRSVITLKHRAYAPPS
jgi:hypothetical protein